MNDGGKLSWSALEYEETEKSADWYWALGVIAITASLTAFIYNNYFFGILILLSAGLLYFFAKKSPEMIEYELNDLGLRIGNHLYPFENLKSFYVETRDKPTLFIKTERFYMPIISIPIEDGIMEEIHNIFIFKNVPEEAMREHPSHRIIEGLGL
jgi:hypothetical protein